MPGKGHIERRYLFRLVKMLQARCEFIRADPYNDRARWWRHERDSLKWALELIGVRESDYDAIVSGTSPSWQASSNRSVEHHVQKLKEAAEEKRGRAPNI